jgi:hypothetical protein
MIIHQKSKKSVKGSTQAYQETIEISKSNKMEDLLGEI